MRCSSSGFWAEFDINRRFMFDARSVQTLRYMISDTPFRGLAGRSWRPGLLALWFALTSTLPVAGGPAAIPLVPKWERFERTLRSPVLYADPLRRAALTAVFTSPSGERQKVYGFWDGGRMWKVRFSPDQPGIWTYQTACSDSGNSGLKVTGQFLCGAPVGQSRFNTRGPVRVSHDHRHFEHLDDTPFFWLGDSLWAGSLQATPAEWDYYTQVRSRQGFTVVQWAVASDSDAKGRKAFSESSPLIPDIHFFSEMDARIDLMNRAGLLSALAPLRELTLPGVPPVSELPEDQAILLLRYMVARWDAYDVAWILTCEGDNLEQNVDRWKRIGRAVFGDIAHAPVMVYPGESYWVLNEFRREPWVDFFGCRASQQINDESIQWLVEGPVSEDWFKEPERPLILTVPFENEAPSGSEHRPDAFEIRRALCWSLLAAPTAGVNYGAQSVWNWLAPPPGTSSDADDMAPDWKKALFMPGAKDAAGIAAVFEALDFWRLRPAPDVIAHQPGLESPSRHIAAARTGSGDMLLVYVPNDRNVELVLEKLPPSPVVTWINPHTGERSPGMAVYGGQTGQFPTPGPGDWLLLFTSSRN
jgi:hypothetical protein